MATRDSLLSYYTGNSARFDQLQDRFGDYLEQLSAIDKLRLIMLISEWQLFDTQEQGDGGPPTSLEHYCRGQAIESLTPLGTSLRILQGCTDSEALVLLQCLASQLREGVFLS